MLVAQQQAGEDFLSPSISNVICGISKLDAKGLDHQVLHHVLQAGDLEELQVPWDMGQNEFFQQGEAPQLQACCNVLTTGYVPSDASLQKLHYRSISQTLALVVRIVKL